MSHIEMENLKKTYDHQQNVLDGINLEISEGEFFVLVGPSGSGKSTLLRMIAGLEEISGGLLKMNGNVVNHLRPKERNLSMVFQNYALYPHLTVEQNILFGLHARKVSKSEQKKRLMETAEMMGLGDLLKRKPKQLSGGQRQRVALARAVVSQAPICLMDEPLSNLDAKLRAHMRMEIKRLQQQLGLTLVYVTHDQVEAMTMGDRIMVLHDGEIQQVGDPITLYNEPANLFVASFIGSPKINLTRAKVQDNQLYITDELKIPLRDTFLPKKELIVGIRAEHIQHATDETATHELEVITVEHLGNETSITFSVGNDYWTAKWIGQWQLKAGDKVKVSLTEEYLSFFDPVTEELIQPARVHAKEDEVVAI
ncbi:sn-glycerol 3-phosphate transport system ATP-binding protein [Gracilibacillus halotolerans]|uniref:sn-glycerol 3-phosphate transport system ATP-binding protein n=1 Tax=Gracilibacillus halotolerans TaxID=74386 RepID=A0A841RS91_9BACI|nr:ABC transporter ATP-binding protein [Gracilibacillus halotolerans]MBB6513448.1 sn-glycerol 3-phosphate transport system ATP-binding protein [Gracilibacillus halotolerans]